MPVSNSMGASALGELGEAERDLYAASAYGPDTQADTCIA